MTGLRLLRLVLATMILPLAMPGQMISASANADVRPALCAGRWYPGDSTALAKQVDRLLSQAQSSSVPALPVALICPHAGYTYSAPVAAGAYATLREHTYKKVVVLAFSHRHAARYRGVDVPEKLTAYATPLGQVPIDREACDQLLRHPLFESNPKIDRGEHSLELQLPFLQRAVKDIQLVPLLVGQMSDQDHAAAARAILSIMDEQTLLVASSDFTHYGPNYGYRPFQKDVTNKLNELAEKAAAPLRACDYDGFAEHLSKTNDTICGRGPISLLLRILSMQGGALGVRAAFDTSGRMTGDWTNSVTYQSFVFTRRPETLTQEDRAAVLALARRTVTEFLNGQASPNVDADELPASLRAAGACFVTLENHGELRGCIGNMIADRPLYQAVMNNARSACQDRRFVNNPVTAAELPQLHIEISYLTPMKRVADPSEIVVGRHGLLIALGQRRGVLLPQVAYERGWTRETFLAQTCRKAGLPPEAWRRPNAEIYSFEAEVFGEPEE